MTDLLSQLRAARRDLVLQIAESQDPERHLSDAGLLVLLANVQGSLTAIGAGRHVRRPLFYGFRLLFP
jgi:hypothetical protein